MANGRDIENVMTHKLWYWENVLIVYNGTNNDSSYDYWWLLSLDDNFSFFSYGFLYLSYFVSALHEKQYRSRNGMDR